MGIRGYLRRWRNLRVIASGTTFFGSNYRRHIELSAWRHKTAAKQVVWMVGVGGADEFEYFGQRFHSFHKRALLRAPLEPIEHIELANTLSKMGDFELHVQDLSGVNLAAAMKHRLSRQQLDWIKKWAAKPRPLRAEYAHDFLQFWNDVM